MKKAFFLIIIFDLSVVIFGQSAIEEYLQQIYAEGGTPGFSVAVITDDSVIYNNSFGVERLGYEKAADSNTVYQLGSITKSMTSIAALQLAEGGLLVLDDPIIEYIPWFRTANKEVSDRITMRMLLSNTSGLPVNSSSVYRNYESQQIGLEALVRSLNNIVISSEPGESYGYSNIGYSVAGYVISTIAGMDFHEYMDENLFKPLGMNSTTLDLTRIDNEQTTYGHGWAPKEMIFPLDSFAVKGQGLEPAGSRTITNLNDMSIYLQMLLNRGKTQSGYNLLNRNLFNQLWVPNISSPALSEALGGQSREKQYGLGWEIEEIDGRTLIYHSGGTGSFSTFAALDIKNGTAALILTNTGGLDSHQYTSQATIINNVLHLTSGENLSEYGVPIESPDYEQDIRVALNEFSNYAGTYLIDSESSNSLAPRQIDVYINDGTLYAELITDQPFSILEMDFLSPVAAVGYSNGPVIDISFDLNSEGRPIRINCYGANYQFVKQKMNGYTPITWNGISFLMKEEWNIKFEDNIIKGSSEDSESYITIMILENNSSVEELIDQYKKEADYIYPEEFIASDYVGQIYFSNDSSRELFCYSYCGDDVLLIHLTSSPGKFTKCIQEVISPILNSKIIRGF